MPLVLTPRSSSALASSPDPGLSAFAWKLMQAEDRRFALRNLKLLAIIAASMVSFFAILDHFAYPKYIALFAALRWTCASITMVLLLVVRSRFGKRYFRAFTVLIPMIPALFVAITIFVTRDPATAYYAGLSLCIVAIGFLFHWTYKEAFAVSGLVLLLYLLASLPSILEGMNSMEMAGLFSNLIFLVATGVVVVAGSVAHYRIRVEEFRGRERLRQQKMAFRQNALELRRLLDELEETESQLIQSGKMASLGQLSAGVIHEIGNPLNHSNQALFLLRRRLRFYPEDDTICEAVEDIQDSIDRMKEIVRDLREFSHKRSESFVQFPVRESIDVALRMLGKEIDDHSVQVDLGVSSELEVRGVKNQLAQVYINLIHNAIQAMIKAGPGPHRISLEGQVEGEDLILSVRDNGPGIPAEIRDKIFDPFFTTKEAGEGTGLGLSICFRIIEAHRGTIQVESDGTRGTEFRLRLPRAEALAETDSPEAHHDLSPQPILTFDPPHETLVS